MTALPKFCLASLLAVATGQAQQLGDSVARDDSVLFAALVHLRSSMPAELVAVDPGYTLVEGTPGTAVVRTHSHSAAFLRLVAADSRYRTIFRRWAEVAPDSSVCGGLQRMSREARSNGVCQLRGVNHFIGLRPPEIADSVATVVVGVSQASSNLIAHSRSMRLTLVRREASWIVIRATPIVET